MLLLEVTPATSFYIIREVKYKFCNFQWYYISHVQFELYWGHPLFNDAWLDLHVWSTLVFVEASDHKAIDEELSCTLALCAELQYARFHLFNVGNYTLNIPSVWIVHNTQFNLGNMGDVWLLDLKCGWNCLLYTVLENSIQTKWCRSSSLDICWSMRHFVHYEATYTQQLHIKSLPQ